jgi:mRNA interferase RelE/StbE
MKGFDNKYKIKIGNYRIGLTIDKNNSVLTCNRIAHRKDIYKIFP